MNTHFNAKSLAFYVVAIGFVVVLFSVTTAYGNTHLHAPTAIDGRYSFAASNLPGCLKADKLILNIQESGIYLTGSLLSADADDRIVKIADERPSLTGEWNDQQLTLSGRLSHLKNCDDTVHIQGTVNQNALTGNIRLESASEVADFAAQREESKPEAQSH
ncbi:MAG TPA: hypothetical protein V6C78_09520 [Crinalium sp.]|jgi:hypothetical protein